MNKLVFGFALLLSVSGYSQDKITDFYFGYSVNAYRGDFSGYTKARNAFHAGIILNRDKKISGELNLRIGGLAAETLDFNEPVATFVKTNYFSLNYGLNVRFLTMKNKTSFHAVPGVGILRFTPRDFEGNDLAELSNTRDSGEEFSNVAIVLPLKLQLRHRLSYRMGAVIETGFLNTRTDYLDNISKLADPDKMDNVLFLNLGLSYLLTDKQKPTVQTLD